MGRLPGGGPGPAAAAGMRVWCAWALLAPALWAAASADGGSVLKLHAQNFDDTVRARVQRGGPPGWVETPATLKCVERRGRLAMARCTSSNSSRPGAVSWGHEADCYTPWAKWAFAEFPAPVPNSRQKWGVSTSPCQCYRSAACQQAWLFSGHCKSLAPTWAELADSYKDNASVAIAHVDCTVDKPVCNKAEIKGYPTLKVFYNGEEQTKYQGEF